MSIPDTLDFQALYDELLMIPRSITGEGYLKSLEILSRYIPFELEYYPSGSKALDWTVPPEWHLERAQLKDLKGNVILDTEVNPLHVLNYSTGFQGTVSREELEEHLYTDSRDPDQIPYVTSYYKERWGFCLSENMKAKLTDPSYEVDIKASLNQQGNVVIGICDLPGRTDRIVQITSYMCHPNMFNNELSGPLTLLWMYLLLASLPEESRLYTYRFIINPETIGSICYLSRHADELREKLEYGMTVNCTGSFYANEYVNNYGRIRPVDLSLLKEHLDSSNTSSSGSALSSAATVISGARQISPVQDSCPNDSDALSCFHHLLTEMESCYEQNFLKAPLTFKMTRQSMVDEIHHMLASQNEKGTVSHKSDCTDISEDPCTNLNTDSDLSYALSMLSENELKDKYIKRGAVYDGLSNEHRITLMRWAVYHSMNSLSVLRTDCALRKHKDHNCVLTTPVDRIISLLEQTSGDDIAGYIFQPYGGADERQYGSALLQLPVVNAFRCLYSCYGEYHSSHDNQSLFSLDSLMESAIHLVKFTRFYERRNEKVVAVIEGEPQLGSRGLYPTINCYGSYASIRKSSIYSVANIVHVLNLADGSFTVEQLARIIQIHAFDLLDLIDHLCSKKVLAKL